MEKMFRLDIELCYPVLRVVRKKFSSLKMMRQWEKRNAIESGLLFLKKTNNA